MHLTKKDKSLLLLIAVLVIFIWSFFSFSHKLLTKSSYNKDNINQIINIKPKKLININNILYSDLKDKIIILKFWHHSCITCIQNIVNLENKTNKFGNKVAILTIHSAKFDSEKKFQSINNAVAKYNIRFPVIIDDDFKIKKFFKIETFPKYIIIDPTGNIVKSYSTLDEADNIDDYILQLINQFRHKLNDNPLNYKDVTDKSIRHILNFPSRLSYSYDYDHNGRKMPVIFISNIGDETITIVSLSGKIIDIIGSKGSGFKDGSFKQAKFNKIQGMVYKNNKLYIADAGNNAIRVADFTKKNISTLIGNGKRGKKLLNDKPVNADEFALHSPLDIDFFPNENNLVVANSGNNQLINYNLKNKKITLLAGNGDFNMVDGSKIKASLAQTYDIEAYENKLYFIDSRSSSLRYLDIKGNVKTILGHGIDKYGYVNSDVKNALMQNPTSLTVDDTGIYIIDNLNNAIRHYKFNISNIYDYKAININNNKSVKFSEPSSIISISDKFYIADSNNHRIIQINRADYKASQFNIMLEQKISAKNLSKITLNKKIAKNLNIKSNEIIEVDIMLKKDWKINEKGPSYLNLLQITDNNNAKIKKTFDWNDIINNNIEIPPLKQGNEYILQGNIYYCQDKKYSLCYIKDYQSKIISSSKFNNSKITIEL